MYQHIYESLSRQQKGLTLLEELIEEEYQALLDRDTNTIVSLEFSLQELIRQLGVEKALVMQELAGTKVLDYISMLPDEQADELHALFQNVDDGEQQVSRLASRNAQLSLALLDQSSRNLVALTSQVAPSVADTYGRSGGMNHYRRHPQAAIISGRL